MYTVCKLLLCGHAEDKGKARCLLACFEHAAKTRANGNLLQHGTDMLIGHTAPAKTLSKHMISCTGAKLLIEIGNLLSIDTCRFADWDWKSSQQNNWAFAFTAVHTAHAVHLCRLPLLHCRCHMPH